MDNHIHQEAYHTLSALFIALGVSFGVTGVLNVLEGRRSNAPAVQKVGEQQIKIGRYFTFLAPYIDKGTLPDPEIMKYLATR